MAKQTILTPAQRRLLRVLFALGLFVLANSAYLFVAGQVGARLTVFYQLMLISHLVGGAAVLVLATVFLIWHLGRVKKLMHVKAVASGVSLTTVAYLLFASGLFIIYEANTRDHYWIFTSHRVLALLLPLAYGTHRFVSHFKPAVAPIVKGAFAFVGLVALVVYIERPTPPEAPPVVETRADPFVPFAPTNFPPRSNPFFPASTTTESGKFFPARLLTRNERGDQARIQRDIDKLGFAANVTIGAETCRRCHPDTVAQWEASAHRFSSFNNPYYRAAVEKLREDVDLQTSQWCASCHDPAIMFAGNMTKEIKPETPESQAGLTCLACHAIEKIHGVEGNGNYHLGAERESPYLGDNASKGILRWLADQLTKAKPTAHKRMMKKPFFETSEFCATCHKVSLDKPLNNYKWIRGQDEYDNWHDSGVAHNAARTFYLPDKPRSCQDCHMPLEAAPLGDVSAKNGKVKSHRFLSVNTALPYLRGDFETIKRIEEILAGTVSIDVFAARYADGTWVRALDQTQPALVAGEEVIFDVVVRNKGVGHTFPGGTNDSNQGWIDFRITDAETGEELFRSGAVDEKRFVDPKAHFYRTVFVRHDGTWAEHRDAWNFHVPAFNRTIGPGTADVARYGFTVPRALDGRRVRIEAKLLWRKFNRAYMEFVFNRPGIKVPDLPHLKGQKIPDIPITTLAASTVTLPVAGVRGPVTPVMDAAQWMRFNDHGIASLLQGAFNVAEGSFRRVAELQPERPDGPRNLARRWIQSATPQKAAPFLEKVDAVAPRDPQRPYFWGRYFERMDEFARAEEAYVASLKVFPKDRDAWRRLGGVRYKLHDYEGSLAAYLEVLKIDPEDREAHKRRLDIYRQLGKERKAAEAAKALAKYRKDDEGEQVARGFLQRHEEVNHEAQRRHVHR